MDWARIVAYVTGDGGPRAAGPKRISGVRKPPTSTRLSSNTLRSGQGDPGMLPASRSLRLSVCRPWFLKGGRNGCEMEIVENEVRVRPAPPRIRAQLENSRLVWRCSPRHHCVVGRTKAVVRTLHQKCRRHRRQATTANVGTMELKCRA